LFCVSFRAGNLTARNSLSLSSLPNFVVQSHCHSTGQEFLTEPRGSLRSSQESVSCPFPEAHDSPHLTLFFKIILILYCHRASDIPNPLFPLRFLIKDLYTISSLPCPYSSIFLDFFHPDSTVLSHFMREIRS
jgi:hypothetical protein